MTLPGFTAALQRRRSSLSKAREIASEGSKLSRQEVDELENQLRLNPHNVETRNKLLGYYLIRQFESEDYRDRRSKHVLWIIEHEPEAAIAFLPYLRLETDREEYAKGRSLWLEHVKSGRGSRELMENAALFLSKFDRELAIELWDQAQTFHDGDESRGD